MSDDTRHPSFDAPGQGPAALEHLRRGCEACVMAWLGCDDPARRLVAWAREAGWTSDAHVDDAVLVRLRLCDIELAEALSVAAHLAGCARCTARFDGAEVGGAVDRRERRDDQAAERFVTEMLAVASPTAAPEVAASPRAHRRRTRARVAAVIALAAAAALLARLVRRTASRDGRGHTEVEATPEAAANDARATPRGRDGGATHPRLLAQDLCHGDQTRPCEVPRTRGACMTGVQRCTGDQWSVCAQTVTPTAERCDNRVDDDCDGAIDEDCGCLGDLTTLEAPPDRAAVALGERVTFRWAPSSCPARALLFRVRDLATGVLVVDDVPVSGTSLTLPLSPTVFTAGHDYRWTVRVQAPSASTGEFAAQFSVFTVR